MLDAGTAERNPLLGLDLAQASVLIIDMQRDFMWHMWQATVHRVVARQIALIQLCEREGIPLFVAELRRESFGRSIPELRDAASIASRSTKVYEFEKRENDAFSCREFSRELEGTGRKQLLLTGMNANFCVRATAAAAKEHGYEVVTSCDLMLQNRGLRMDLKWYRDMDMLRNLSMPLPIQAAASSGS